MVSYKAAVVGSAPWAERQFESVEKQELVIGDSANAITDGLERAIEQVPALSFPGASTPPPLIASSDALTLGFLQLVKGQTAFVTVRSDYAYGDVGLNGKVK